VKETEPVTPAPEDHVWAVHAASHAQIQAMIALQWWTGMRPGEVVLMRTCDIDRSDDVWVYTPERAVIVVPATYYARAFTISV